MKKLFGKLKTFAFKRKKRFYIILIVICTLVLLLDIGIGKLMPSAGNFPSAGGSGTDITLPDGSDITMPDTDSSSDEDGTSGETSESEDAGDGASQDDTDSSSDTNDDEEDTSGNIPDASSDDASESGGTFSDGGSLPDMSSADGEMPDMDSIGEGDFSGAMPGEDESDAQSADTDASEDSTDADSGSSSDTDTEAAFADAAGASGVTSVSGVFAVLQAIKSFWVLILIIAAAIDALSIFMLVQLARKAKAERELEEKLIAEAELATGEVHIKRPQEKKKISPVVWIILAAGLIAAIIIVKVLSSMTSQSSSQTEATVYTETASTSDISSILPGTGTLTEEDSEEVSLPSQVEITEWYVSDGDTVEEGDKIAKVDTDSALTAIASVQEVLDTLDEAIESAEDSDTTGTVTATASGRVKAIYAQTDTTVIDTIYESGSLILLSLDGLMAVEIETETEVSAGDTVTVALSDDTEVTGTVESSINGIVVVTLTDDGTDLGESVSVSDADGNTLGSGELYIHSELKVLAFSGTVSSISVSVEDEVDSGDTLLSLTDIDNSLELELLLEQRSTLEDQIATLFTLYQDGYLYAETSGVVSGISSSSSSDDSEDSESSDDPDDSESSDTESTDEDSSEGSSDESTDTSSADNNIISASVSAESSDAGLTASSGNGSAAGSSSSASGSIETLVYASSGAVVTTSSGGASVITVSSQTDTAVDTLEESEETEDEDDSSYANYLGIVVSIEDTTAAVTVYPISSGLSTSGTSITVELESAGIYSYADGTLVSSDYSEISQGDTILLICEQEVSEGESASPVCVIVMSAASDSSDESSDSGYGQSSDSSDAADSSLAEGGSSSDADTSLWGSVEDASGSADASGESDLTGSDTSGLTASASSESASSDASETLSEEVSATYSVAETTYLSITPQDYMYITITIDELDILSISEGLEAEVTLDAFAGQSFEGVVESIDLSGTNEGGNSKYTAVVRIDRGDDMLAGMNASVKITLDTSEDVLCIPAEALVEDETGTYVYTSYDESSDTLGGLVEVTTGISDGEYVEITSGLSEGDTYCYSVLDTVNYSSSAAGGSGTFSFNRNMFGAGMQQ